MTPAAGACLRASRSRHHARGAVALEFALVAPVLFMLIFGVVGLFVLMMQDVLLESSVRRLTHEIQYQQPVSNENAAALAARVRTGLQARLGTRLQSTDCAYLPVSEPDATPRPGCAGAQSGDLLLFTVAIRPTVMFLHLPERLTFRRVLALRVRA